MASKLSLYTTLLHHLIKDKRIALTELRLLERTHFIWLVTKNVHCLLLMYIKIINYGPVKTFVSPLFIFWIIFSLDLELKFIEKL